MFQAFACGHPIFPTLFVKNVVLSLRRDFSSFIKNEMVVEVRSNFWDLQYIPFVHMSIFMPVSVGFDSNCYLIGVEIWFYDVSSIIFIALDYFKLFLVSCLPI